MLIFTLVFILLLFLPIKFSKGIPFESLSLECSSIIRGICCFLIILHHLAQSSTKHDFLTPYFTNWVGFLSVSCFFFFSGYGLMKSFLRKPEYAKTFLTRRILPIVVAYTAFLLAYWVGGVVTNAGYTAMDLLTSFFTTYPVFTNAWYVAVSLLFYLAFFLMMCLLKDKSKWFLPASLSWCIVWSVVCGTMGWSNFWCKTCFCIPLGIGVALYESSIVAAAKKHYWWFVASATSIFACSVYFAQFSTGTFLERQIYSIVQSTSFVAEVLLISMWVQARNRLWSFLATISLEVYLTHPLFMKLLRSGIVFISNDIIWGILVIILTIPTAFVAHFVLTKVSGLLQGHK